MHRTVFDFKTGQQKDVPLTPEEIAETQKPQPPVPYDEARRGEYPPIGDQLDAIMKWLATENEFNIPDELKSIAMKCMSVKAKYPKPEGKD